MHASEGWLKSTGPLVGYGAAVAAVAIAWSLRDQNLIRAQDGIGYGLGIAGASLMLLLLVYPIRKRARAIRFLGSVRFWFRVHMIFGILGPLLVLFHSNFNLGSVNGRVALFCTLVVASSGLLGRYLYAKIHYGLYGHRATLDSLARDAAARQSEPGGIDLIERINGRLQPFEEAVLARSRRVIPSLAGIVFAPIQVLYLKGVMLRDLRASLKSHASRSPVIAGHRSRLQENAERYLDRRLATYRKLAQLRGCERLFRAWHIVHFPLFLVMLAAAVVHVVAVHAY
jgi:hypothetical protein